MAFKPILRLHVTLRYVVCLVEALEFFRRNVTESDIVFRDVLDSLRTQENDVSNSSSLYILPVAMITHLFCLTLLDHREKQDIFSRSTIQVFTVPSFGGDNGFFVFGWNDGLLLVLLVLMLGRVDIFMANGDRRSRRRRNNGGHDNTRLECVENFCVGVHFSWSGRSNKIRHSSRCSDRRKRNRRKIGHGAWLGVFWRRDNASRKWRCRKPGGGGEYHGHFISFVCFVFLFNEEKRRSVAHNNSRLCRK
jgi:hypothetical protein